MKVKTLGPVELDGKKIKVGSVVDLPDSQADQLIDAGAAEAAGKAKVTATAEAADASAGEQQGDQPKDA